MGVVEEKVSSRLVIGPGALLMCAVAPILVIGAICVYGKRDSDSLKRMSERLHLQVPTCNLHSISR